MSNLLSKTLPLGSLKKIDKSTDFYHKNHSDDYALFYKTPVFLEKGDYICNIEAYLCINDKTKITIKVFTPSQLLCKKIISNTALARTEVYEECQGLYRLQLPFHLNTWDLTLLILEIEGKGKIKVVNISFRADIKTFLKKEIETDMAQYVLSHKDKELNPLLKVIDPELIDFNLGVKVATYLYKGRDLPTSLSWFLKMSGKNPVSRICAGKLIEIARQIGDFATLACLNTRYKNLTKLKFGPWNFETNATLVAYSIPQKLPKVKSIPFCLYLDFVNISGDQAITLIFKKGCFTFGKSIGLYKSIKTGYLLKVKGNVNIPQNAPSGTYDIYFMITIPKVGYAYHAIKAKSPSAIREAKIGHIILQ